MPIEDRLVTLLVVRAGGDAFDFYVRAFGAREVVRFDDALDASSSHSDRTIDRVGFSVSAEARAW